MPETVFECPICGASAVVRFAIVSELLGGGAMLRADETGPAVACTRGCHRRLPGMVRPVAQSVADDAARGG